MQLDLSTNNQVYNLCVVTSPLTPRVLKLSLLYLGLLLEFSLCSLLQPQSYWARASSLLGRLNCWLLGGCIHCAALSSSSPLSCPHVPSSLPSQEANQSSHVTVLPRHLWNAYTWLFLPSAVYTSLHSLTWLLQPWVEIILSAAQWPCGLLTPPCFCHRALGSGTLRLQD